MGRWSRHPMGSDGALDAKDELFSSVYNYCEENNIDFWDEEGYKLRVEFLEIISLTDLKNIVNSGFSLKLDRFVLPYTFLEHGVNRPELKEYLVESFDYHDDITGEYNYCSKTDENGEVLELKHIRFFKENYDAIMSGEIDLPEDEGLLSAIANAKGFVNKR
jgi:hypothetical protein